MDELADIIERYFPAPRSIERLQPVEGRCWTIGQAQPHQHTLKQINREFLCFARHKVPPTHPERVAHAGGVQSTLHTTEWPWSVALRAPPPPSTRGLPGGP